MQKAAERVPWFLTSLGVALLVVGVLLGPAGQIQSHAQTSYGGCSGAACCNGNSGGTGGCCEQNPTLGCSGGNTVCTNANPANFPCTGCSCQAVKDVQSGDYRCVCKG